MGAKKIIKVCGMRAPDNLRAVEALGVDMLGFIFYSQSPRFVTDIAETNLPSRAKRVGVFVNEKIDTIMRVKEKYNLDFVQLHGEESADYCARLRAEKVAIIKAFSVASDMNFQTIAAYEEVCDYFLFDTKTNLRGGSGQRFDWDILHTYEGQTPFLLSGGLSVENATLLTQFHHPHLAGYDLNSCFEYAPAMKDIEKLRTFLRIVSCV